MDLHEKWRLKDLLEKAGSDHERCLILANSLEDEHDIKLVIMYLKNAAIKREL